VTDAERHRLTLDRRSWLQWGPYLAERAWGTVREDYSDNGDAWISFPHDHARSRAYRWSEDGLAGLCDVHQHFCLAWAFWNGRDPILKERIFGLSGPQGNHGEDAKEYWWYLDSTPTHSYMKWRYVYPHAEFPYAELVAENGRRGKAEAEYELLDTGVFDGGYWNIVLEFAKAAPDDIAVRAHITNESPRPAVIDVLPTLWFRNTWSWGRDDTRPRVTAGHGVLVAEHPTHGRMALSTDAPATALVCDNDSNKQWLWNVDGPRYPKDGIADHVLHGAGTVNPDGVGTKGALHHHLTVAAGATAVITVRFSPGGAVPDAATDGVFMLRREEADEFYASITPPDVSAEERNVMRQAFAGMLWSKQLYHYDVAQWLDGDPAGPPVPGGHRSGRNREWRHLNNIDVISMPDTWEYPWFAAWDLAFHCVALAHVDAVFAKQQLLLLCREWYMHPNGQLPAYEWNFGDVNPPVHAWAALRVFEIDGGGDHAFLARIFQKLLLNFTWWVNRKDVEGDNVFEGGFLGLDNIGPIDRSAQLPVDGRLEQSDGTAWMAMFCLDMLEIAITLARQDSTYEDMATKFLEHFALIAKACHDFGLWDEQDGFYFDVLRVEGLPPRPLRVFSMVGLLPLCGATTLGTETLARLPWFTEHFEWFIENRPEFADHIDQVREHGGNKGRLLAIVGPHRLERILTVLLDEDEFLSPYGIRALSRRHRDHPFSIDLAGVIDSVDYEPGESASGLFGGNSNWRGPVWFPVNLLIVESLRRYGRFFGETFTVEMPTRSGRLCTLTEVAEELARRLRAIFLDDERGRRPVFGPYERFQTDPSWHDSLLFYEYFHGDDGHGLGASHQTGWTGLVADLILRRDT
jgi:Mannosylglycerate hydrolase MGH1-like glycoside hydrolase domain